MSSRPIDTFIHSASKTLQTEYLVIGKKRVSSLFAWSIITFFVGVTVTTAFLASRSGALEEGSAATTQVFQASIDFSSMQGTKNWYFVDGRGNGLTYVASDSNCGGACWKAAEAKAYITANAASPGQNDDVVRRWVAPDIGSIRITGSVRDLDGTCSGADGVQIRIKKESTILWDQVIASGDSAGRNFDVTTPIGKNERVGFEVNRRGNNSCDRISLDPKVEFSAGAIVVPPAPITGVQTFQASTDFSSTQSQKGWYYMNSTGDPVLTYSSTNPDCPGCWKGNERYFLISSNAQHPGEGGESIRGWMSPGNGSVRITGTVKDLSGACAGADGVVVKIKQDPTILWQRTIADGDAAGQNFDITTPVAKEQLIYFMVGKGSLNNWCDWTGFDPKIEFTPGSAPTPPPPTQTPGTEIYQASSDFSGTQGYKGWWYEERRSGVTRMTYAGANPDCAGPCWKGLEQYSLVGANWMHPPATNFYYAIRRWQVPSKGTVRITGRAYDLHAGCGDGVKVDMQKEAIVAGELWSGVIADGDTTGKGFDIVENVDAGNSLQFRVSSYGNNYCDGTFFDPKIEFTPESTGTGKLTVKKVFLPGVSAAATIKLDGAVPSGVSGDTVYWDNLIAGNHTLTVTGAPKTFYAVCPGASSCPGGPVKEGSSITFNHQYGANDFIQLYLGASGSYIVTGEGVNFASSLLGAGLNGINLIVDKSCRMQFETNVKPSDPEWPWIQAAAQSWSKSYITVEIVHSPSAASLPILSTVADVYSNIGDDYHNLLIITPGKIFADDPRYDPGGGVTGVARSFGVAIMGPLPLASWGADIRIDPSNPAFSTLTAEGLRGAAFTSNVAHEIGHTLGLGHVDAPQSIMGVMGLVFRVRTGILAPTASDIEAVNGLYAHCAPNPAALSMSFNPSPATWTRTAGSDGVHSTCRVSPPIPQGIWYSNFTIKETGGSSGVLLKKAKIEQYDANGTLRRTDTYNNFYGGIRLEASNSTNQILRIQPRKSYNLRKITLTLSGTDDAGKAVSVKASVNTDSNRRVGSCGDPGQSGTPVVPILSGGWSDSGSGEQ